MSPSLAVVADNTGAPAPVQESLADHIRRLQAEAKDLAMQQLRALEEALDQVGRLSQDVASGGEAYPVGAREIARQLAEDAQARRKSLDLLLARI